MSAIDTRGLSRDSLFLIAQISVAGRMDEQVKVRNLSDSGMMGEGPVAVVRGNRVVVELRNLGKVGGVVAWTQGTRFGVRFDNEIESKLARVPLTNGQARAPHYTRAAVDREREPVDPRRLRQI